MSEMETIIGHRSHSRITLSIFTIGHYFISDICIMNNNKREDQQNSVLELTIHSREYSREQV